MKEERCRKFDYGRCLVVIEKEKTLQVRGTKLFTSGGGADGPARIKLP